MKRLDEGIQSSQVLKVGLLDALVLLVKFLKRYGATLGPLNFVCPIGWAGLALGNVRAMASLERRALGLHGVALAFLRLACRAGPLLAEPNDLLAAVNHRLHDVRLGRMVRRAARPIKLQAVLVYHFFLAARMLSTMFG